MGPHSGHMDHDTFAKNIVLFDDLVPHDELIAHIRRLKQN